jgi:hypothetical protein
MLCIKYYAVRLKRRKDRRARASGEKKVKKSETSLCDSFCLATFFRCDPENERVCSIAEKWKKIYNY